MNRKFLDVLYEELTHARAKVKALEACSAFTACDKCGCSEDNARWSVAIDAAKDRVDLADRLISTYIGQNS